MFSSFTLKKSSNFCLESVKKMNKTKDFKHTRLNGLQQKPNDF